MLSGQDSAAQGEGDAVANKGVDESGGIAGVYYAV